VNDTIDHAAAVARGSGGVLGFNVDTIVANLKIAIPQEALAEFCRKWKIERLEVFGSVLRNDFRSDSDVDLLATFAVDAQWSFLDHMRMERELVAIFGREVDLLTRRAVETSSNRFRRQSILTTARTIYAA
jgi:predicted nucleotidyltransferase